MANKQDMVKAVSDDLRTTQKDATLIVDTFLENLIKMIAEDGQLQFAGYGTFTVTHREARKGINPLTSEPIDISAVNIVGFRGGKKLKDAINPDRVTAATKTAAATKKKPAAKKKVAAKKKK